MCTIQISNIYNTKVEYPTNVECVQYKYQMCTIQMLNIYNTRVKYMSMSCDDHNYICISLLISDYAESSKLSLFDALCVSPNVYRRKIKYAIKHLIYK